MNHSSPPPVLLSEPRALQLAVPPYISLRPCPVRSIRWDATRVTSDAPEDLRKQVSRQVALVQPDDAVLRMPDEAPAGLEEPLLTSAERTWSRKSAKEHSLAVASWEEGLDALAAFEAPAALQVLLKPLDLGRAHCRPSEPARPGSVLPGATMASAGVRLRAELTTMVRVN